jgi:hypothetical protein
MPASAPLGDFEAAGVVGQHSDFGAGESSGDRWDPCSRRQPLDPHDWEEWRRKCASVGDRAAHGFLGTLDGGSDAVVRPCRGRARSGRRRTHGTGAESGN